jgi:hypothetical protein
MNSVFLGSIYLNISLPLLSWLTPSTVANKLAMIALCYLSQSLWHREDVAVDPLHLNLIPTRLSKHSRLI